jgi:hypothetical protein
MSKQQEQENALVFSYLTLRKAIGWLGTLFPFVLALGALLIFGTGLQDSVSLYYYTGMGDVFVGTLFAIGFFLLSYKGYERKDDIAGDLACLFAVGVALFPTAPENSTSNQTLIGYVHFAFAALFFLTLIYFSLFLFTKSDPNQPSTRKKRQRNAVYWLCGIIMLLCIGLIAAYHVLPAQTVAPYVPYQPVFWLEALAVVAFGFSWLTKGEAILGD